MRKRKPGSISFYLGFALLVLAFGSSLAFGLILGGPLVAGAIALVAHGLTATGRKAAGTACAGCTREIVHEHEAEFCERCDRPLHASCTRSHLATAHELGPDHPFR